MARTECLSATPRILGIDDFAFRKGQRYGTILVDLEKNCPVDVLPNRDAKSVEQWLKQHPGVEVVSRDRAEVYRNGVTAGAPDAIQVADRFHLLANLRQSLQDSLIPFKKRFHRTPPTVDSVSSVSCTHGSPKNRELTGLTTQQQKRHAERRLKRHLVWEQIQALRGKGHTQAQIAGEVEVSVKTVGRLSKSDTYPERKARTRSVNDLTPFLSYVQEQWNAERRCVATLYHEVQEQGFTGSYGSVYGAICRIKKNMALYPDTVSRASVPVHSPLYSVRQMTWLFLRSVDEGALPAEQRRGLETALSSESSLAELRDMAHRFVRMIRQRDVPALSTWISAASGSSFVEMKRLSLGLDSDLAAVRACLEHEWSNGQVEGQVNRLKFVKRSMYGRGSFALLKARVLHQNKAVA